MHALFCLCVLLAAPKEIGNLVADDLDEIPARIRDRMTQYSSARSATLRDFAVRPFIPHG